MRGLIRNAVKAFCCDFVRYPYLCYTEHGQHALFYSQLLSAIPEHARYALWHEQRVCTIQKEYPTASSLGKPKRQHWDVALLRQPLASMKDTRPGYDFLELEAVVEFGMNEAIEHLVDDIYRLAHPESNVDYGFVVHFCRFSEGKDRFSRRDWSPASDRIISLDSLVEVVKDKPIEIWYAVADLTGTRDTGVWLLESHGPVKKIACA